MELPNPFSPIYNTTVYPNQGAQLYAFAYRLLPFVLAATAGLSWGESPAYLVGAFLTFLAWGMSTTRLQAFGVVLTYYLFTARGVPAGGALFFSNALKPTLIWVGVSALLAIIWAGLWSANWKQYGLRLVLIQLVITVPPVGLIAVGNPLTGAGMLFPGWGFFGYAAALACGVVLAQHGKAKSAHKLAHFLGLAVLSGMLLALITYGRGYQPKLPPELKAVDTWDGDVSALNSFEQLVHYQARVAETDRLLSSGKRLVVMPESATGAWTPLKEELWSDVSAIAFAQKAVVVAGTLHRQGQQIDNSLVILGGRQPQFYKTRVPVPFRDRGRAEDKLDPGTEIVGKSVFETDVGRLGLLICYEVLVPWPVLTTAAQKPDILVAGINGWWAPAGNSIPALQRSALQSWARLFGVPGVAAINR